MNSKNKFMKMTFKILAVLIAILILGFYGIFVSKNLLKETGYFILPISATISIVVFATIFFLLYQFARREEIREIEPEELEKALYECRLMQEEIRKVWYVGKPTGELYNKSWEIAKRIIPNLKKLKNYKAFLQRNPGIEEGTNRIYGLWKHYHGGKRIKTKSPYKEMGKDLIFLCEAINVALERYQ